MTFPIDMGKCQKWQPNHQRELTMTIFHSNLLVYQRLSNMSFFDRRLLAVGSFRLILLGSSMKKDSKNSGSSTLQLLVFSGFSARINGDERKLGDIGRTGANSGMLSTVLPLPPEWSTTLDAALVHCKVNCL